MAVRAVLIAATAACVLVGGAACSNSDEEPDPTKVLSGLVNVGVNTDVPGFSEYTAGGVWQGFDISLVRWLGKDIGFEPQFVTVTVEERLTKLQEASDHPETAAVTMVVANFSMNDERRETIDMVGPYFIDAQGFLTIDDNRSNTVEDFAEQPVCVTTSSTNEQRIPGTRALATPAATLSLCLQWLRAGIVKAISSDIILLEGMRANHAGLRLSDVRIGSERYGIGIPNKRPKLCNFLRDRLAKFIDEEWEQKMKDNMPYASTSDRKPNSDGLVTCEKSGDALRPLPLAPATSTMGHPVVDRRRRRGGCQGKH